jgi:hypothetical protein
LLQPGELLQACAGLRIIAFEDGFDAAAASPRFVQRIAARRDSGSDGLFPRHALSRDPVLQ